MKKKNPKFPNRKISETFLDFSMPILNTLEDGAPIQQVKMILKISFSVWNAVILDKVKGSTKYVPMLKSAMETDPVAYSLIEQLILRKNEMFADDLRMIGDYQVIEGEGEWRLRAEARDPFGIP